MVEYMILFVECLCVTSRLEGVIMTVLIEFNLFILYTDKRGKFLTWIKLDK